jgi:hypothetical protein
MTLAYFSMRRSYGLICFSVASNIWDDLINDGTSIYLDMTIFCTSPFLRGKWNKKWSDES